MGGERHRVRLGDRFQVIGKASTVFEMEARVTVEFDDGRMRDYRRKLTTIADRVARANNFASFIEADGRVVRAVIENITSGTPRGRVRGAITTLDSNLRTIDALLDDYVETGGRLDRFRQTGPGGGDGFLSWEEVFADRAGNAAAVDHALAVTNAFRKVYGLAWYYHASSDVADRIFNAPAVVNLGGATPTGFTTSGNNALFWNTGANIALVADQEGAHISLATEGKDGRTVTNDQGVQTIASTAGAPVPWPLKVSEDEVGILRFPAITDGEAADRHSAYMLVEEWLA